MKIIFPDGSILDTTDEQSKTEFKNSHPEIISEIEKLGKSVKANEQLADRIRKEKSA